MNHSHKKQKDVWKHGPYCWFWPYREYIKTARNGGFWEELLSENDFETVLATFCCCDHVATLLRQFRRSLQIKKIITNAPSVLQFAE